MVDGEGLILDEAVKKRAEAFLERFAAWMERVGVRRAP